MHVVNRDGQKEEIKLDKIIDRIKNLSTDLKIDAVKIGIEVVETLEDDISTSLIDTHTAQKCHEKTLYHPDYYTLAGRLMVSDHHKNVSRITGLKFSKCMEYIYENVVGLLDEELYKTVRDRGEELDKIMDYKRDFNIDYFGFITLARAYLIKHKDKVIETPQDMFMRVAVGIWGNDLIRVKETYEMLSLKYFTHATPTLFNAGIKHNQLFSCFLYPIEDNLENITRVLSNSAFISKWSGGIGIHMSKIRADKSIIRGTNGESNGIVPLMVTINALARYINQGGKRKGSYAIYLEPWHADIESFLECMLKDGDHNRRTPDINIALWIPDIFMKRALNGENWSLMCPDECKGLVDLHGEEFEKKYLEYEQSGKVRKTINARKLLTTIVQTQIETGEPYMLYKDTVNRKSNQQNVGTITGSNLCSEITEYTDKDSYACCVLSSIVLSTYVDEEKKEIDHEKLYEVTRVVTRNLNRIIDTNYYPVEETRNNNLKHRPLGIGVQGLQDVFYKLKIAYDSDEAIRLDKEIHETIYYAALSESCELAKKEGVYETYEGSPISKGIFQFDMWTETEIKHSGRWDWEWLRAEIKKHGVRNCLLTASMPTASTSQIMGSIAESFEPMTANCYTRRTLAGECIVFNKYMAYDFIKLGIWDDNMRNELLKNRGSVQNIEGVPQELKNIYKTVWEIKQKNLIDHSVQRGIYIDQSQSLNLYYNSGGENDVKTLGQKILNGHVYGWKSGLKTGSYYIRTKPAANSISFTVKPTNVEEHIEESSDEESVEEEEECLMCSG
jgi:ribonucleoside-diphosphate reductase alpha chain